MDKQIESITIKLDLFRLLFGLFAVEKEEKQSSVANLFVFLRRGTFKNIPICR